MFLSSNSNLGGLRDDEPLHFPKKVFSSQLVEKQAEGVSQLCSHQPSPED